MHLEWIINAIPPNIRLGGPVPMSRVENAATHMPNNSLGMEKIYRGSLTHKNALLMRDVHGAQSILIGIGNSSSIFLILI